MDSSVYAFSFSQFCEVLHIYGQSIITLNCVQINLPIIHDGVTYNALCLSAFCFKKGLATATQNVYTSAKKRFMSFCDRFSNALLPASEENLCAFVSFLSADGLTHKTIKCYLSAVRNLHLE